ncbi:MAG: hypothetical protein WCW14_00590 [Candidatus Paceibacterota bacterium]|jgi:co-chaperonin GroES (HSP10)
MLKPRQGYVIAEIVEKENASGIVVPGMSDYGKEIIIVSVAKGITDIKKGDNIVLSAVDRLMKVKDEKGKEFILINESDICAIK